MSKVLGGTLLVGSVLFTSCNQTVETQIQLIPEPFEMTQSDGMFKVSQAMLVGAGSASNKVNFRVDPNATDIPDEGYQLEIDKAGVRLVAKTETGLFYGKQTLLQLLTPNGLPYVKINDHPRFPYRGLHLDVSRHFFDKEEVKKLMNVMSYYKLNTLHLHLTDAGGWRLQIDKYPKLTQEGAFRTQSDWREWWDNGKDRQYLKEGTEGAYGGYYTKDDIRDMLAYAAEKHITIIPEIEFPAHSDEVFVAYPELCCAGKSHTSGDFCIGNPKTFEFMENVLTEVIELFPSEYIHIGGDEAGKNTWKTCPKCQALMKKEKLANVDELQSYMIRKAEEFLNSKGRRLIGWDEILEGGLAPEATVMSWRGEAAGFKSARMGHDVIMTPGSYMYFDFYQADPRHQPVAIGGYTPIRKVYSYNPIPQDSLTAEEAKHFLGVQANTWTEYIPTPEYLEYMMFPRALAVAEIGWTPQEKRDWQDFKPRVNAHIPVLQRMGLNPFPLSNELEFDMVVDTIQKEIRVTMDAEKYPAEIHYTTDGSTPTASSPIYQEPIVVKDSAKIVAGIFVNGQLQDRVSEQRVDYHKGIGKSIRFNSRLYPGYMAGGINAIINGYRGGLTYLDQRWQGYTDNLDCVIDLGEVMDLHQVSSKWMQLTGPGVYQPEKVEVLTSEDGKNFTSQGVIPTTIPQDKSDLTFQEYTFQGNWKARYVQLKAQNPKGFIFVDEIVIW
ncbi:family 20 glycosylhydrolase [Parabacteroides sp. AGMB00274]|uniref:beta-N-acetylhexosaminidase n=1 Tax=Parabacteroides faecalis TaxID=2924040 RepID=A0ABT0C1S7_9BACT|nr:family 20 glycosylhydrolase [Parabacteroides sp.]MCJ2380946.1 family 20 glycosylhydrolase [Parabacteroides faecalis]